jgi:hypothetical protein
MIGLISRPGSKLCVSCASLCECASPVIDLQKREYLVFMNDIEILLCGEHGSDGIAKNALSQLATSIGGFSAKAISFLAQESSDETLSFGPFCARVLLENSCAALVGRLDPFRMLYLSEFQNQSQYEHGKRAKSSFSWTGDVIPVDEKPQQPLWSVDYELPKISRALFARHLDHIYWKPAIEDMLDFVSSAGSNAILSEILMIESETYLNECRGKSSQLYSTLSKAVHWEFFTTALVFDEITVKAALRDTCLLVANLGLISHFIPTSFARIDPTKALNAYISYRELIP